jgi:hypothetical protein
VFVPGKLFSPSLTNTLSLYENYRQKSFYNIGSSGRYYKPITIVNDDSSTVNKLETSLIDDARVVIYDRHMLIVQAIGDTLK